MLEPPKRSRSSPLTVAVLEDEALRLPRLHGGVVLMKRSQRIKTWFRDACFLFLLGWFFITMVLHFELSMKMTMDTLGSISSVGREVSYGVASVLEGSRPL